LIFAVVVLGIAGLVFILRRPSDFQGGSFANRTIALPADDRLTALDLRTLAFSPDGTELAYVAERDGAQQIFLRSIETSDSHPVEGTEEGSSPFFSPDGKWLGFAAFGKLEKVPISGGTPAVIASAPSPRGALWGDDNRIIFSPSSNTGLFRVSASGGPVEMLTQLDDSNHETTHRFPHMLPDGKTMLFTIGSGGSWDNAVIVAQWLDTGQRRVLIEGGSDGFFVRGGYLAFLRAGKLMAAPFDPARVEITGPSVAVVKNVMQSTNNNGCAQADVSRQGWLAYVTGTYPTSNRTLTWVDRKDNAAPLNFPSNSFGFPRYSPDGHRIAFDIDHGSAWDTWVYDIDRSALTRFAFYGSSFAPIWSPDGKQIAFRSKRAGQWNIYLKPVDGGGAEERLTNSPNAQTPASWSPDGRLLVYTETPSERGIGIYFVSLDNPRKSNVFLQANYNSADPTVSPDGRWLAYTSDESGDYEVYVQPFPAGGRKWLISKNGGVEPVWDRSGKELYFRNTSGRTIMNAHVELEPAFTFEPPRPLLRGHFWKSSVGTNASYDVAPNGQQFLVVKENESAAEATQIDVVQNWINGVKKTTSSKE
jgi:Tol biopolymer transport system component